MFGGLRGRNAAQYFVFATRARTCARTVTRLQVRRAGRRPGPGRADPGATTVKTLERLRGGLMLSAQAWSGSAIDDPLVLAAMADAAQRNGAAGVRMQGVANLQ